MNKRKQTLHSHMFCVRVVCMQYVCEWCASHTNRQSVSQHACMHAHVHTNTHTNIYDKGVNLKVLIVFQNCINALEYLQYTSKYNFLTFNQGTAPTP